MKKWQQIGALEFRFKKDAIAHYKKLLNSYEFDDSLDEADLQEVINLLKLHPKATTKIGAGIKEIRIERGRYKTKSFKVIRTDSTSEIFSYMRCINGNPSPFLLFSRACREAISDDLRLIKLSFFKSHSRKGQVKCQETGKMSFWEELNVDHRQPNTFSVIVDRFIELKSIDLHAVECRKAMDGVHLFKDATLIEAFRRYHKEKANLRLVRKDKNLGRSYLARLSRQNKDLVIT